MERSRGHIVLENSSGSEIVASTTSGVVPVPIGEVPAGLAEQVRRQAVAADRIVDDAAVLVWQRRVREQESSLMASINLADVKTVVGTDGR